MQILPNNKLFETSKGIKEKDAYHRNAKFIIVCGMPKSGKTSLLTELKKKCNIHQLEEIGGVISKKYGRKFYLANSFVDKKIMVEELKRDKKYQNRNSQIYGLEQWHIGNLVFSKLRGSDVYARYLKITESILKICAPLILVYLKMSKEEYIIRSKINGNKPSKEEIGFIDKWDATISDIFSEFNLKPYIIDATITSEVSANIVCKILN